MSYSSTAKIIVQFHPQQSHKHSKEHQQEKRERDWGATVCRPPKAPVYFKRWKKEKPKEKAECVKLQAGSFLKTVSSTCDISCNWSKYHMTCCIAVRQQQAKLNKPCEIWTDHKQKRQKFFVGSAGQEDQFQRGAGSILAQKPNLEGSIWIELHFFEGFQSKINWLRTKKVGSSFRTRK